MFGWELMKPLLATCFYSNPLMILGDINTYCVYIYTHARMSTHMHIYIYICNVKLFACMYKPYIYMWLTEMIAACMKLLTVNQMGRNLWPLVGWWQRRGSEPKLVTTILCRRCWMVLGWIIYDDLTANRSREVFRHFLWEHVRADSSLCVPFGKLAVCYGKSPFL